MPVETIINREDNLIIHTITNVMDLPIIVSTITKTLKDPNYFAGMNAVWYFHDIVDASLSAEDLIYAAEYASKNIDVDGKPYRLALVAEDDLPYGLLRVYEAWSNERPVTIQNFRSIDAALDWINMEEAG